jgi:epoxyqueuosine reductase
MSIASARGPGEWVDLLELLWASDDWLLETYGRWYLADRNPVWLRRNALVILGNVASVPADERVVEVLRHYLESDDAMLRAHALWAGRRLGLVDVVESVRDDDDPVVRAEWNVLVNRRTV